MPAKDTSFSRKDRHFPNLGHVASEKVQPNPSLLSSTLGTKACRYHGHVTAIKAQSAAQPPGGEVAHLRA